MDLYLWFLGYLAILLQMYKDMNDENKRNWSKTIVDYLQKLKKLMKHPHQEISVLWQRLFKQAIWIIAKITLPGLHYDVVDCDTMTLGRGLTFYTNLLPTT